MTHEELPQQSRPIILEHDGYRALVNGEVALRIPVVRFAESIVEAIGAEDLIPFSSGVTLRTCCTSCKDSRQKVPIPRLRRPPGSL